MEQNNNNNNKGTTSPSSCGSQKFCRICHEGEGRWGRSDGGCAAVGPEQPLSPRSPESSSSSGSRKGPLIAPCKCTGSVALIHLSCLEHWLTASNTDKCELCGHVYEVRRVPRGIRHVSHLPQLQQPSSSSPPPPPHCLQLDLILQCLRDGGNEFNVRNLIADVVCFFLLTPLLIVSTYLCVLGATQYFIRERWEAGGLVILSLFLLGVYFTWIHVTIKYHTSVWRAWQGANQEVRVILDNYYDPTTTTTTVSPPPTPPLPHPLIQRV